jgi:putative membrane protein
MEAILDVLILAIAVFAVAKLMPTVHVKNAGTALIVAVVYSLINFLLGWLFFFLSFPLLILTLGLFKFVINAFMLWLTDKILKDFRIDGLGSTLLAAFLITIFSSLLRWIV